MSIGRKCGCQNRQQWHVRQPVNKNELIQRPLPACMPAVEWWLPSGWQPYSFDRNEICFMRGQYMSIGFLLCSCVILMPDWQSALGFAAKSQERWMRIPSLPFEILWPLLCVHNRCVSAAGNDSISTVSYAVLSSSSILSSLQLLPSLKRKILITLQWFNISLSDFVSVFYSVIAFTQRAYVLIVKHHPLWVTSELSILSRPGFASSLLERVYLFTAAWKVQKK